MLSRPLATLFLALAFIALLVATSVPSVDAGKCDNVRNSVWSENRQACPGTCANRGMLYACGATKGPGCECKDGFVHLAGTTGDCVPESECPKKSR